MKILRAAIFGICGGLLYAIVSFYLITPYLRQDLMSISFFGFQGLIFSICYVLLGMAVDKFMMKTKRDHKVTLNILTGAISGLLSGSFNISVTYYGAVISFKGVVDEGLKNSIISDLLHYSVGCIAIGLILGLLITKIEEIGAKKAKGSNLHSSKF